MFKKISFFFAVFAFFLPVLGEEKEEKNSGNEQEIREYVLVTAASVKESEKDVIGSFSLIRKETIRDWKMVNLNEALNFAGSGLSLTGGSYGQMSTTFIRGASSKHTLFMINNVRLNDPASLSLDVSSYSPALFSQIEVIDGPQSSLYGSDAMGGAVNMIPRNDSGLQATLWGGASASGAATLNFGHRFNSHTSMNIGYSFFRTDGTEENGDFLTHNLYAGGSFQTGIFSWKPFLYAALSRTGIPFNYGVPSPQRRTENETWVAGFPFQFRISEKLDSELTFGYSMHDYELRDPDDFYGPYYHTFSRNLQVNGRLIYQNRDGREPTIIGGEFLTSSIDQEDQEGMSIDRLNYRSTGAWLQQIIHRGDFKGVATLRYDKYRGFPGRVSPRLSLGFNHGFGRISLGVYGLFSQGFRAPKPSEFAGPWGNPDLLPERSSSVEGGLSFSIGSFSLKSGYFRNLFRDMIVYNFETWKMDNSGRDRIRGWQVQPRFDWKGGSISLSYMKLDAVNQETGEKLVRRPDFIVRADFSGEWKKFYLNLMGRWVGSRTDYDEATFMLVNAESFSVFSMTAGYRFHSRFGLFLKISNILDRHYQEILGYNAPGRSLYAGIDFSL